MLLLAWKEPDAVCRVYPEQARKRNENMSSFFWRKMKEKGERDDESYT